MPEKLVFLYLLTNPLCNVAGIYEITERRLSLETGAEKKEIKKILEKFTKDEKIIRHKSWILIIQFGKHQSTNPNIEIGVRRILEALPDEIKALKGFESLSYFTLLYLTYQGDKSPDNKKPMYEEPTIELDESGEEIEPKSKFKLPRGFVVKLSKYYMQVFNIPETSGIYFNYKKTIDGMIELSQKKNGDDPEKINKEIKTKIDNAKKKCDKEGWPKMKLSTILENWNIPEQEIKLDVSERRKL